jgi:signal transduction histidine kinase/DNA-binding response OmpR family regulator
MMSDCLGSFGLRILIARNGKSGLEKTRYAQPDLVLLDVLMPGIDGFETCQRLKADEITRDIPVVFMTALADTANKVKGFRLGAVDYITKPFQSEEVLARITTHLHLRELTERLEHRVRERTQELTIANQRLQREIAERVRTEELLRKSNRAYKALSECNQALVHATKEVELLEEVCRIIVEDCGYHLVWVGFAEHDQAKTVRPVAQTGYEQGYLDAVNVTWADDERGHGPIGTAIRTGKPVVHRDVLANPDYAPWHTEASERGYASFAALPLLTSKEKAIGVLNVYATQPDAFATEEMELLTELANDLAYGITSLRVRAERERAEEELRKHRDRLEELVKERTAELTIAKDAAEKARRLAEVANQAKSTFLAQMSHELRTPLNAVLGFSELMTRDPNLTPGQRANLETIGRSGEHLLALINDVLELSRIEAGRVEVQAESFDLWHMLLGLEELFRLRAETKDLTLVFERTHNVPQYVRTDANKLRQVLINLLGNAVKFTQEGGVMLRVNYEDGDRVSGRLLFEVEDTGPGIAPQEMGAVFDPFVQTESGQKSRTGSGLGLPVSRHFVRMMGGDIGVKSDLGAETVFRFDVPVQLVEACEVQPVQPTRRVVGLEPGQRATDSGLADSGLVDGTPYRLLVVEDVDSNRQLLVQFLQPLGFDVREAVNGQEALDIWQQWKPHLIWMDMRMPVMDGLEASRRIKADARGQDVIIVALTASSFEEDRKMILSQGCDDYIRKPFREADILDALTKHLGVRFVYEETKAQEREKREMPDLRSSISDLPPALLANLERAVTVGHIDRVFELADQIRAYDAAVADALARLADDFEYARILTLIQGTGGRNE